MRFDPEAFGSAMGAHVRSMLAPLTERIKTLESRPAPVPDESKLADAVVKTIEPLIARSIADGVAAYIAAHPPPAGKDGRDGADGRDALDIDILPDVLPGKTYRSKTFARWRGGLIRSVRNTDPLPPGDDDVLSRGWVAVVNGSEGVGFEHDVFDAPRFAKAFEVAMND